MISRHSDDLPGAHPGVERLFEILTSGPTITELAGERDAAAMFRSASAPPAPAPRRWRPRLIALLAAGALAGGGTAAAYASALPTPLQHAAHAMLGFAGVPDTRPAPGTPRDHATGPGPATPRPGTGQPGATPAGSPQAHAAAPPALSAELSSGQGRHPGDVVIIARIADRRGGVPGVLLSLLARPAGQPGWQLVTTATTGPDGKATLIAPAPAVNETFEVTGPGGVTSNLVTVVARPPITLTVTGEHKNVATLTVSCPGAEPGDIAELQVLSAGQWQDAGTRPLSGRHATFRVPGGATYRVLLLPTSAHGTSSSPPVTT